MSHDQVSDETDNLCATLNLTTYFHIGAVFSETSSTFMFFCFWGMDKKLRLSKLDGFSRHEEKSGWKQARRKRKYQHRTTVVFLAFLLARQKLVATITYSNANHYNRQSPYCKFLSYHSITKNMHYLFTSSLLLLSSILPILAIPVASAQDESLTP